MAVVPWAIPGRCPLCGELAQIEFDDAEGNTGDPVMLREVFCTYVGCAFCQPHKPEVRPPGAQDHTCGHLAFNRLVSALAERREQHGHVELD